MVHAVLFVSMTRSNVLFKEKFIQVVNLGVRHLVAVVLVRMESQIVEILNVKILLAQIRTFQLVSVVLFVHKQMGIVRWEESVIPMDKLGTQHHVDLVVVTME